MNIITINNKNAPNQIIKIVHLIEIKSKYDLIAIGAQLICTVSDEVYHTRCAYLDHLSTDICGVECVIGVV